MSSPEQKYSVANPEQKDSVIPPPPHIISPTDNNEPAKGADSKQETDFEKILSSEAFIKLEKFGRFATNICVSLMNVAIANVCLLYALASSDNNSVRLHIVVCVLGYQLCMNQGILILSKYNSWTKHLSDETRSTIQWYLQAIGCVLVTGGSIIIILDKRTNFNTPHAIFGICALVAYLLSFFNDRIVILLHVFCPNIRSQVYKVLVKFIHYATGIAAICFYCLCLCYSFVLGEFRYWAEYEERIILTVAAYLVTVVVTTEFFNTSVGKVIEIFDADNEIYEDNDVYSEDDEVYNEDYYEDKDENYDLCAPM